MYHMRVQPSELLTVHQGFGEMAAEIRVVVPLRTTEADFSPFLNQKGFHFFVFLV